MPEPFRNLINAQTVQATGHHLARVWSGFDRRGFERLALQGLDGLEFKARAHHLCSALEATLPDDFDRAAGLIEASLGPPGQGDDLSQLKTTEAGLGGWVVWSLGEYVARRGLQAPGRALQTLHALTQRFSAEYAIRPFIQAHPGLCFDTLAVWKSDPSAHVRRLVSEGSRPRLPWGLQLKALIADPSPTLPLLQHLQDDASEYVRRSVANHLNDIAKDHPGIVAGWLARHLPGAPVQRQALLRHASRTLIKRGDAAVLKAWGLGTPLRGTATLRIAPRRAAVGGAVQLELTLQSTAARPQPLVIDYVVHHVKASGATSPKVFKGWKLTLQPGETCVLRKSHSLRPVTTRRYLPGDHAVDIQVNGAVVAGGAFHLRV